MQGGSYNDEPSKVVAWRMDNASKCFASQVTPRHWATGKLLADATMWQTICLKRDVVKMAFSMNYTGAAAGPAGRCGLHSAACMAVWSGLSGCLWY